MLDLLKIYTFMGKLFNDIKAQFGIIGLQVTGMDFELSGNWKVHLVLTRALAKVGRTGLNTFYWNQIQYTNLPNILPFIMVASEFLLKFAELFFPFFSLNSFN